MKKKRAKLLKISSVCGKILSYTKQSRKICVQCRVDGELSRGRMRQAEDQRSRSQDVRLKNASTVYPPHPTVAEEHDMRLSLLSPPRYGDVNLYQEVFFYEKNSYAAKDNGGAFPARSVKYNRGKISCDTRRRGFALQL